MIRTRDHFRTERNHYGETVFACTHCGQRFIERDGDCVTDRELSDHISEEHRVSDTETGAA